MIPAPLPNPTASRLAMALKADIMCGTGGSCPREYDMYLAEYVSKPIFWILGIFIFVSWLATIIAAALHRPTTQEVAVPPYYVRQPHFTRWLTPYLNSWPRHIVAVLLYLVVLGLQLLEGSWVVVTGFRWIQKMLSLWPSSGLGIHIFYAVSVLFLVCFVSGTVAFGGFIIMCQVSCLLELVFSSPRSRMASSATNENKWDIGLLFQEVGFLP
jgi:hypothetical protein